MVGDQPHGHIHSLLRLVSHPGNLADSIPNGFHGVYVKNGVHILHHHGQTLQTHAGVNIFLGKFLIMALSVALKLSEYIVPDFHKAVAVAAHFAVGSAAAILLSPIVIDLRAGAAGTCAVLPEIIAVAVLVPVKAGDLLCRNTDLLVPDFESLLVLPINGGVEPVRVHADGLCEKFPAPGNGFLLKVIPEGKIPQHLKECQMAGRFAHVLNICGAHTLLTGGHAPAGRDLLACKVRL